ncbi:MAG: YczE/YyaS/YitT family protein [Chloroflexota bacterium]
MLKPIRKERLLRDLLVIELGLGLYGLAIAMMIRANLGTSAWSVLDVALSQHLGVTPGTMTVSIGFLVLSGALILKEQIGWGTLANILSIGPWEDLFLRLIPPVRGNLLLQSALLLSGIALIGLASAIYIGVDAGAGPRDTLMLAFKRKFGWSVRLARGTIEAVVITLGWLLGGPVGIGTLAYVLLIGPMVQAGFKLLHVEPHKNLPPAGPAAVEALKAGD